jgi:phage-related baseplate assembly protein
VSAPVPAIPDLLERDPAIIQAEVITDLEALLGRTLQPGQVERLLGNEIAYRESLVRQAVQAVALESYLAFATGTRLDFLGQLVDTDRLPALPATATIRFTLVGVQGAPVVIPAGTRVQTTDTKVIFATIEEISIAAGDLTGDVVGRAATDGAIGNDYLAGAISVLLDPIAFVSTASNTTTSADGADVETDERYRDRIRQAPNRFSVAGPSDAYRFYALSVNSHIIDATVTNPTPGTVKVYVLLDSGLPGGPLLADVLAALSDDKVRPLTDTVDVDAPTEVPFVIDATVRLFTSAAAVATMAAVTAAAEAYAADRRAGIGRDIVQSQLIAALSIAGVYQVTLADPADTDVGDDEWANCTDITITQGASAEG